ncbi:MAG TPA: HAMP domain-containing sensor histidine kinase, partial [Polyangiaceae bacterium]|nr:HAMP domain-containing sensor histidine kinase [Polyangiaceae bacterium]
NSTLEAMRLARDQAEKANRVKSTFLRMVSHELRTPLAAIQLQLDRLARSAAELPTKQRDLLLRCHASTRRLTRLVDSVLEYTRIEGGRIEISRRSFNPSEVAAEILAIAQPHADQKGIGLNLHATGELPQVETDPRLVRLVLLNLVENAVKFTERGGVDVTIDVVANHLKLCVQDSGPGIGDEQQPLVFEPFEQLGPTENKHLPGIGLGLALVREMVGALGGRVDLQSKLGEGACFTVSVPVRCVEAVA